MATLPVERALLAEFLELVRGNAVDLDSYRQQPEEVVALLREAGFTIRAVTTTAEAPLPHGDILAVKPAP